MSDSSTNLKVNSNPFVRWSLIISGILLTIIGVIGMFVPLLPTTIFLILAAWCFARSSEKYHNWLHTNKLFGKYLSNYNSGMGMTLPAKIFSLVMLWTGITISAVFFTNELYIRILLLAVALGVTIHLVAVKTNREKSNR